VKWSSNKNLSLYFLYGISFLTQMIIGLTGIAVPIYANQNGASPLQVGLIGSAGGLIYSFMPFVSGVLSDRFKRKLFISGSMILYSFSCILYIFIEDPVGLMFIKILEWLSVSIFWPAVESLITDSSKRKIEESLRRFNISWGLGMIIGPILGGVLISVLSIRAPFFFSFFISVFFGLGSIFIVVERDKKREFDYKSNPIIVDRSNNSNHSIFLGISSIFLFSSITGIILTLFPSYATDLGISAFDIGFITFTFGITRTIAFYQANRLESRIGKLNMFIIGSLILCFGSLLTYLSSTVMMFILCFLIYGFGSGVSYAASISFILRKWGESKGYAAGVFESLIGLGFFVSPLVGGFLSESVPKASYIYGLILSLSVLSIHLSVKIKNRNV
jgi:MFS family permease